MSLASFFQRKYDLPTSLESFEAFVDKVYTKYKFTDRKHCAALISIAVRHLPPEQGRATLDYFGQYVRKNLANYVANHKSEVYRHEAQILNLKEVLQSDPLNQQARDALQKAADEGSELAKKTVTELESILNTNPLADVTANNVTPIGGSVVVNNQETGA